MPVRDERFVAGIRAAASVIGDYNSTSMNPFRLDDVVLCKLNVTKREKPRRNPKPLEDPKKALTRGVALGLADMHRRGAGSSSVVEAALSAGLSIKELKEAGVDPYDRKELRKAGLK